MISLELGEKLLLCLLPLLILSIYISKLYSKNYILLDQYSIDDVSQNEIKYHKLLESSFYRTRQFFSASAILLLVHSAVLIYIAINSTQLLENWLDYTDLATSLSQLAICCLAIYLLAIARYQFQSHRLLNLANKHNFYNSLLWGLHFVNIITNLVLFADIVCLYLFNRWNTQGILQNHYYNGVNLHFCRLAISILQFLFSKLTCNEARFQNRLLLNDLSPKELGVSWFSWFTFSYLDDLITIGREKPLEDNELDNLIPGDTCVEIMKNFEKIRDPNRPLMWNIFKSVQRYFILQQIASLVTVFNIIAGPVILREILFFVEHPSKVSHPLLPLFYGLLLFCSSTLRSFFDGQTYFLGRRFGLRIRAVLISLIYKKSLRRLQKQTPIDGTIQTQNTGNITNLMSIDSSKILEVCCYLMYLWTTPLQTVMLCAYLLVVAGYAGLAGFGVLLIMVPLATYIGRCLQKTQKEMLGKSDARIAATNELLQGIRIIKFFAWESRFEEKLKILRELELKKLWAYILIAAFYRIIWIAAPIIASFCTFWVLTVGSGQQLSVSTAFTCLAIFQTMQRPLAVLPDTIVKCIEALVSFRRIESFLDIPILEDYININSPSNSKSDSIVHFKTNSQFSWYTPNPGSPTRSQNRIFKLQNLGFAFPENGLTVICGATASGKTTLLSALLGELHCVDGGVHLFDGKSSKNILPVAYASQTVWLKNATIKDNIIFGSEYDKERYESVLQCCALLKDLANLPGGDMTEIGEKGVNLSGGQKARVSLARAVYSKASIVMMDDPLSAVDAPTAKHLLEQAICGPLMQNRTKILVSHAVNLCVPKADLVVQMNRGKVTLEAPLIEPLKEAASATDSNPNISQSEPDLKQPTVDGASYQIIEAETRIKGSVKSSVYLSYCNAAGGILFVVFLIITYSSSQLLIFFNDLWIKIWADAFAKPKETPNLSYYIGMYALIGSSAILALFIRIAVVATGSLTASRSFHSRMVTRILRAPVRFFETTPMGRIINRFTKDLKDIDQDVAFFSGDFLFNIVKVLAYLVIILVLTPISAIGIIPVSLVYASVGKSYLFVARELKRMDSNTRSPIFSHFGESLVGAPIIRAYSAETQFETELQQKVDKNHQAFSLIWVANRWLGIRIDFVASLITLSTVLAVIYAAQLGSGVDEGYAGLSITYSLSFSESLLWLVRMHATMEMEMNAVERVEEYLGLEEEAPAIIEGNRPPSDWPNKGHIVVDKLTLTYSKNSTPVLSNISFDVASREKIGIVGRTGAGKTTLSLAFFRFMEPESGRILIDNVDIQKIGLFDLRSKLTVIPQDPVLFSGTLRSNLDPFNEYTDSELWNSLKEVHFLESFKPSQLAKSLSRSESVMSIQSEVDQISLESTVLEGGSNLSQGQRQLLCLARAVLKKSKVIILDEATASIDHETDVKIQNTIRERFKDSTLLCIAHRLSTIMDFDKILVLDKGTLSQFDTPYSLIEQPGIFRDMCLESNEFQLLLDIAKRKVKV
ncbi:P-loop containing nucleoside triphosphate hydrolase protein [Globomyces pollinis-pini]|nr:P-loop containing nucleoside triphosphate hydrolase protein [Globomyces pollinis-pini]